MEGWVCFSSCLSHIVGVFVKMRLGEYFLSTKGFWPFFFGSLCSL